VIFQDPYSSLNPRMTVGDIIGEPMKVHGTVPDSAKRDRRVRELLHTVGLNPRFADRYPHEMSGGQRQRVGIARALSLQPEFIVCDEAISALDVSIQAQIIALLKRLAREHGTAVMLITHDMGVIAETADLWFHCLIMLAHYGLRPEQVLDELARRAGTSGIEEKAVRKAQRRERSD